MISTTISAAALGRQNQQDPQELAIIAAQIRNQHPRRNQTMNKVKFNGVECDVVFGEYYNGRTSIRLTENGSPYATATINDPDTWIEKGQVLIKNYSENEGMADALVEAGIVEKEEELLIGLHSCSTWVCALRPEDAGTTLKRSAMRLLSEGILHHSPTKILLEGMTSAGRETLSNELAKSFPKAVITLENHPPSLPPSPIDLPPMEARRERQRKQQSERLLGNGVVPATAELAFRTLAKELGIIQ